MKYSINYDLSVDEVGYIKMRLEQSGLKPSNKNIKLIVSHYSSFIAANFDDDVDFLVSDIEDARLQEAQ